MNATPKRLPRQVFDDCELPPGMWLGELPRDEGSPWSSPSAWWVELDLNEAGGKTSEQAAHRKAMKLVEGCARWWNAKVAEPAWRRSCTRTVGAIAICQGLVSHE